MKTLQKLETEQREILEAVKNLEIPEEVGGFLFMAVQKEIEKVKTLVDNNI